MFITALNVSPISDAIRVVSSRTPSSKRIVLVAIWITSGASIDRSQSDVNTNEVECVARFLLDKLRPTPYTVPWLKRANEHLKPCVERRITMMYTNRTMNLTTENRGDQVILILEKTQG